MEPAFARQAGVASTALHLRALSCALGTGLAKKPRAHANAKSVGVAPVAKRCFARTTAPARMASVLTACVCVARSSGVPIVPFALAATMVWISKANAFVKTAGTEIIVRFARAPATVSGGETV